MSKNCTSVQNSSFDEQTISPIASSSQSRPPSLDEGTPPQHASPAQSQLSNSHEQTISPIASPSQSRSPTQNERTAQQHASSVSWRSPSPREQRSAILKRPSIQKGSHQTCLISPNLPRRIYTSRISRRINESPGKRVQLNRTHMFGTVIRDAIKEQMQMIRKRFIEELDEIIEETTKSLE